MPRKPDLDQAYSLETPDDSVRLYRDWAADYDDAFVAAEHYRLPEVVALAYAGRGGVGPVLDIGAGTGAVGAHLRRLDIAPVDGIDISPEMLDRARAKNIYQTLSVGDLTRGLDLTSAFYSGAVSAGTFTHGHLGPEVLDEVIRITSPGGLVCLSVHAAHFEMAGFAPRLEMLAPRIRDLRVHETRIYGDGARTEHRLDKARIVSFHRA